MAAPSAQEILKKYSKKLESDLNSDSLEETSREYEQFKQDMMHELSRYERWAKSLGNFLKIKVAEKDRVKIQRHLDIANLDVTASEAVTLSVVALFITFLTTIFLAAAFYLINGTVEALFVFLGLIASTFVFYYAYSMPQRLANSWRLKASSQMVPAVLYVVVYMKHTSNLERAIAFAAEHLEGPLALDFRKIFYDVEIWKFSTIKQSLDNYLDIWKDYSPEFIEAFNLIESSLYEPSENRRVDIDRKSVV